MLSGSPCVMSQTTAVPSKLALTSALPSGDQLTVGLGHGYKVGEEDSIQAAKGSCNSGVVDGRQELVLGGCLPEIGRSSRNKLYIPERTVRV